MLIKLKNAEYLLLQMPKKAKSFTRLTVSAKPYLCEELQGDMTLSLLIMVNDVIHLTNQAPQH